MRKLMVSFGLMVALFGAGCNRFAPQSTVNDLEARVKALEDKVTAQATRLDAMKRNPSGTTITLLKVGDECATAKVSDYRVGNHHERFVHWDIIDECNLIGGWRIELEFTPIGGQFPFATQKVRSRGAFSQIVHERIKGPGDVNAAVFQYKINLVRGSNVKPLADPELEVEPPVRLNQ